MKAMLVNYRFTPTWLLDSGLDYVIYDRSDSKDYLKDFPQDRIVYEENIGNVDFPKLSFLVENYDRLPDVFLWGKTNLFKYITEEEWDKVKDNKTFTPLLRQDHKTYSDDNGVVCAYKGGMYYERNPLLYFNNWKYAVDFPAWAEMLGLPNPPYIPFPPGGNYILTREVVHRHPKELYKKMRDMLDYTKEPLEAHLCERSYYLLWA